MAPYRDDQEARLARQAAKERELRASGLEIRVALPCSYDWEAMSGDDRSRFCPGCAKHVYNLSAMTVDEATRLVEEKQGDLCVGFYRRHDGTVMTADCPRALRRRQKRQTLAVAVAGVTLVAGGVGALERAGRVHKATVEECARRVETRFLIRWPAPPPEPPEKREWIMGLPAPRDRTR
ncbi:MAG TPA: hypothetical protein VKE22_10095 [Haliangiales bacterium]|nr:hypothetical protein [Haliangiales bacterium]